MGRVFGWFGKKVAIPAWLVISVVILGFGGLVVWWFDFGKIASLNMVFPQSRKLEDVSYLECRGYVWGHLHTASNNFQTGTRGWTKNILDERSKAITVEIKGREAKVRGVTVSGVGGDFQIISDVSAPGLLAQERQDGQYTIEGQWLLIYPEIGQLIISRTINFGGGLLNDSLIYTCESKVNPNLSTSDRAIGLLEKMVEVKKIKAVIEKAGNNLFFLPEGENNGEVRVEMGEGLSDHTSRIATFYVHVQTGVVTVEDVVNAKRISLEEWKTRVRKDWSF